MVSEFTSASGHKMYGIRSIFHDVRISGVKLEKFYFYLLLGSNRPIALIGDDFISCCSFTHEPKQDILANIDLSYYCEEHGDVGDKTIDVFELLAQYE